MKGFIKTFVLLIVVFVSVMYLHTGSFDFLNTIKDRAQTLNNQEAVEETIGDIVAVIKREITNPAPLIWDIASSKAHLTHSGVIAWTNTQRMNAAGLPSLSNSELLNQIAEERLQDMFEKQYFEHISPQGIGASDIAEDVNYGYIAIGENIALGNFENDEVLVQAWMDSPGHRANILNDKFTEIGVAVATGTYEGRKTWIGVQIFAKPASDCPKINQTVKNTIDGNMRKIQSLKVQIDILAAEIDQMRSGSSLDSDEYNSKVKEHNELVREFNSLNTKTKQLIQDYNVSVQAFNRCLTSN